MIRLEEAWKTNPRLKSSDILKRKTVRRLRSVLLKYKSGKQYKSIFESLLNEESKTDRKIKESQTQNNMKITFSHNNGKRYAYFLFGSREDYDASLLPGNELKISYKSEWSSKGVVVKITGSSLPFMQMRRCASSCSRMSRRPRRSILTRSSSSGSPPPITA
jgi:regulator of nonsense transcripts 1